VQADFLFDENDIQKTVEQMTGSHLNNIMQLALFYTANDEIYAINVAKIQNFVILDEIDLVPNHDPESLIVGVSRIRDELVTFVDLDRWLGIQVPDRSIYQVGVVCNFNRTRMGFMVKEIIGIEDRYSHELMTPGTRDLKVLYVTHYHQGEKEHPCSVFDAEKLIKEVGLFVPPQEDETGDRAPIRSDRLVLVAEDSPTAAAQIRTFLEALGLRYELYEDGEQLIDRLEAVAPEQVGLVITDLEMPGRDGFQVISHVKASDRLKGLPVVVNSSMTSSGIADKVHSLGAADLVSKSDLKTLYGLLVRYLGQKESL
jgi:two-component system chemotaxis response regulator CheV